MAALAQGRNGNDQGRVESNRRTLTGNCNTGKSKHHPKDVTTSGERETIHRVQKDYSQVRNSRRRLYSSKKNTCACELPKLLRSNSGLCSTSGSSTIPDSSHSSDIGYNPSYFDNCNSFNRFCSCSRNNLRYAYDDFISDVDGDGKEVDPVTASPPRTVEDEYEPQLSNIPTTLNENDRTRNHERLQFNEEKNDEIQSRRKKIQFLQSSDLVSSHSNLEGVYSNHRLGDNTNRTSQKGYCRSNRRIRSKAEGNARRKAKDLPRSRRGIIRAKSASQCDLFCGQGQRARETRIRRTNRRTKQCHTIAGTSQESQEGLCRHFRAAPFSPKKTRMKASSCVNLHASIKYTGESLKDTSSFENLNLRPKSIPQNLLKIERRRRKESRSNKNTSRRRMVRVGNFHNDKRKDINSEEVNSRCNKNASATPVTIHFGHRESENFTSHVDFLSKSEESRKEEMLSIYKGTLFSTSPSAASDHGRKTLQNNKEENGKLKKRITGRLLVEGGRTAVKKMIICKLFLKTAIKAFGSAEEVFSEEFKVTKS